MELKQNDGYLRKSGKYYQWGGVTMSRSFLRLGACPRCRGDIIIDRAYEDSEVCLQCGFRGRIILAHSTDLRERKERKREYTLTELDKSLLKSQ